MGLFMDRHEAEGVTPLDCARLHLLDLQVQHKHGARTVTYWVDEERGRVHCLLDAPSESAARAVHAEAHGNEPAEIIAVDWDAVEEYLGPVAEMAAFESRFRVEDPPSESAFRTILFSDMVGFTETTERLGDAVAMQVLQAHDTAIRESLAAHRGREVKHTGDGFMACFTATSDAVECAMAIQRALAAPPAELPAPIELRIGLSAGEPVANHADLFGAAVNLASRVCSQAEAGEILVAGVIRDLCIGKQYPFEDVGARALKGFAEPVRLYRVRWG